MRKFFLLSAATLLSAVVSAQTVARMDDLKPEQKSMAVSLKLTGELSTTGNSDYRQLRDLCFQMRSVDLSEAQSTAIPNNAFHSRHQLEQITLPTAAKSIGSQAFFACDKLGKIIIPAGVESIGAAAFSGCTALEEIIIKGTLLERHSTRSRKKLSSTGLLHIPHDSTPKPGTSGCFCF